MSREYTEVTGSKILVVGGDADKGQIPAFEGVLRTIRKSTLHPDNNLYDFTDEAGEERTVAGCAAINSRLFPKHVGRWIRLKYRGEAKAKNGKTFKDVFVGVGPAATPEDDATGFDPKQLDESY